MQICIYIYIYIYTCQGRLTINAVRNCHCVSRTCIHSQSHTFPIKSLHIGKSWLSQRCCWGLRYCGMWCRVNRCLDPNLSRRRSGLYFKGLTNSSSRTFRPLKMKTALRPETLPTSYPVMRHHITSHHITSHKQGVIQHILNTCC
jgi:hypothetical protein